MLRALLTVDEDSRTAENICDFRVLIYKNGVQVPVFIGLGDYKHPGARSNYWRLNYVTPERSNDYNTQLYNSRTSGHLRASASHGDLVSLADEEVFLWPNQILSSSVVHSIIDNHPFFLCQSAYCSHTANVLISTPVWERLVCIPHLMQFQVALTAEENSSSQLPYSITPIKCPHLPPMQQDIINLCTENVDIQYPIPPYRQTALDLRFSDTENADAINWMAEEDE